MDNTRAIRVLCQLRNETLALHGLSTQPIVENLLKTVFKEAIKRIESIN